MLFSVDVGTSLADNFLSLHINHWMLLLGHGYQASNVRVLKTKLFMERAV